MEIEEFLTLVRKRRNIRKFKPDPIPEESIEKIIDAARWAQSGANAQSWEFIIVKNKGIIDKIADLYLEHTTQAWHIEKTRARELRHPAFRDGPREGPPGFKDAPVIIMVCGDPRTVQATVLKSTVSRKGKSQKYAGAIGLFGKSELSEKHLAD